MKFIVWIFVQLGFLWVVNIGLVDLSFRHILEAIVFCSAIQAAYAAYRPESWAMRFLPNILVPSRFETVVDVLVAGLCIYYQWYLMAVLIVATSCIYAKAIRVKSLFPAKGGAYVS